jgi:hypothetical protein
VALNQLRIVVEAWIDAEFSANMGELFWIGEPSAAIRRSVRANADVDRHRDGLDGMRAAAGAGAEAADRGIE